MRGGRPPRDSRMRGARDVRTGVLAQEMASELTVVALFSLNTRKAENVITKYVRRVSKVREGAN